MTVEQRENRLQLGRCVVSGVCQRRSVGKNGRFWSRPQSLWPWWPDASGGRGIQLRRRRIGGGRLEPRGRLRNGERTRRRAAMLTRIGIARGNAKSRQERVNWKFETQGVNDRPNGGCMARIMDSPRLRPMVTKLNHHDVKRRRRSPWHRRRHDDGHTMRIHSVGDW